MLLVSLASISSFRASDNRRYSKKKKGRMINGSPTVAAINVCRKNFSSAFVKLPHFN